MLLTIHNEVRVNKNLSLRNFGQCHFCWVSYLQFVLYLRCANYALFLLSCHICAMHSVCYVLLCYASVLLWCTFCYVSFLLCVILVICHFCSVSFLICVIFPTCHFSETNFVWVLTWPQRRFINDQNFKNLPPSKFDYHFYLFCFTMYTERTCSQLK